MDTQSASFFEAVIANPALTQFIAGDTEHKGKTPLYLLTEKKAGREILRLCLETNPSYFFKTITTTAIHAGPYEGYIALHYLAYYGQSILSHCLTNYADFFAALMTEQRLAQVYTGDTPYKGETPLQLLAITPDGRELLQAWSKAMPEHFVKTVSAQAIKTALDNWPNCPQAKSDDANTGKAMLAKLLAVQNKKSELPAKISQIQMSIFSPSQQPKSEATVPLNIP